MLGPPQKLERFPKLGNSGTIQNPKTPPFFGKWSDTYCKLFYFNLHVKNPTDPEDWTQFQVQAGNPSLKSSQTCRPSQIHKTTPKFKKRLAWAAMLSCVAVISQYGLNFSIPLKESEVGCSHRAEMIWKSHTCWITSFSTINNMLPYAPHPKTYRFLPHVQEVTTYHTHGYTTLGCITFQIPTNFKA